MSKTQIICHIVFGTKGRMKSIDMEKRSEAYKYIWGILKNKGCYLLRINGIEDHVHILMEVPPNIALSDIIKMVKQSSSHWLKETNLMATFDGWGRGYFAVSVSPENKERVRNYILNQEIHHKGCGFADELKSMVQTLGMEWYDDEWK